MDKNLGISRGEAEHTKPADSVIPDNATMGSEGPDTEKEPTPDNTLVRAILKAFIPQPKYPTVNHIDPAPLGDNGETVTALIKALNESARRVIVEPSDQLVMLNTYADVTAKELIGRQPDRVRITMTNRHATYTVWLSSKVHTANADAGIGLLAGESLTLETRDTICMSSPSGQASVEAIIEMVAGP